MGLSDVVSNSGTTGFAQVGFVISFVVFTLIVVWALLRPKATMLAAAQTPLRDGLSAAQNNMEKDNCHGQR
jgi:hypothetical protein